MLDAVEQEMVALRTQNMLLRGAVVSASHVLEQSRYWDGLEWRYNPLPPKLCAVSLRLLRVALCQND